MNRWWLLVAFGLILAAYACGDGGGSGDPGDDGPDAGDDGGDDGSGDGTGPDGSVGPGEAAAGQFTVSEIGFGEGVYGWGQAFGTIIDPRPSWHLLADERGACQLWTYEIGDCGPDYCNGVCTAEGVCEPPPTQLSAGDVQVSSPGQDLTLQFQEYGYYATDTIPNELFGPGDRVAIEAEGTEEVPAFSLEADGVDAIAMELEVGVEGGDVDALRMENGRDLEITWSPVVPGTRVRLDILSNNAGHGVPVDAMILCESDDSGRITVPRAFVEAFPGKPYQNACAGSDCPPSSLTRFRSARTEVGGHDVELRVQAVSQFIVIHDVP